MQSITNRRFLNILILSLVIPQVASALIRLDPAPEAAGDDYAIHPNNSHIDTALGRANLNFTYFGCDRNPNEANLKLTPDAKCKEKVSYKKSKNGEVAVTQRGAEVLATYEEQNPGCDEKDKVFRRITTNKTLRPILKHFTDQGCYPSHIIVKDSSGDNPNTIVGDMNDKHLCELDPVKITKPGFPTEKYDYLNMKANDKEFTLGRTRYRFNHSTKSWCVHHLPSNQSKGCNQPTDWPMPVPMIRRQGGKFHVEAAISLLPSGKAIIRAIKTKTYNSTKEVFAAQKAGKFADTDKSQGRIEFETKRDEFKMIRTVVRTYDRDTNSAPHRRSINFYARNVMGVGVTNAWCNQEHCFRYTGSNTTLAQSKCKKDPEVNMNNGGSGNLCASCLGRTPGQCAVGHPLAQKDTPRGRIGQANVTFVQSHLIQNKAFKIMDSGEPKLGSNIEQGLLANYEKVVSHPRFKGCFDGHAPAFNEIFEPDPEVSPLGEMNRTMQSTKPKKQ